MTEQNNISFTKSLKVLVVEDNKVDRRMLESMLSESSDSSAFLKSTFTLATAIDLLEQYEFDVVVLDLNLSDSQGEETLLTLNKRFPKVAIVVNTGAFEDELGIEILRFGAQDFLVKGKYTPYVLTKALHYAVERKRLELELTNAYEKLKEAQSQLVQAEKMKVVGGLASGVAHEVKNPLATILYGVTYLCEKIKDKDEKIETVLENIKDAIIRANNIISDVLDFSSLNKLDKKKEDLNTLVEKTLSLISHELKKKHIKIVTDFDPVIPKLNVDKNRIEQVLINVILNSVNASSHGEEIGIRTFSKTISEDLDDMPKLRRDEFKPGQTIVVVKVEDAGCGIPQDKLDKVFDPFFTTRRGIGGVGLGLSVSQNIMENHNGNILVENKEGGGTIATLIFRAD